VHAIWNTDQVLVPESAFPAKQFTPGSIVVGKSSRHHDHRIFMQIQLIAFMVIEIEFAKTRCMW